MYLWSNRQKDDFPLPHIDVLVDNTAGSHTINLRKFFERIKQYRLRLNLQKCTFGVTTRKLLGYLVSDKGIKVDSSKIKAILEMPPPKSDYLIT